MLLSAVDIPPAAGIPIAFIIECALIWYFLKMGRPEVPRTRRIIRRCSVVLMMFTTLVALRAASFVDPALQQQNYVVTWTAVVGLLGLVILSAFIDALNSMHLHAHERQQLTREMFRRRAEQAAEEAES